MHEPCYKRTTPKLHAPQTKILEIAPRKRRHDRYFVRHKTQQTREMHHARQMFSFVTILQPTTNMLDADYWSDGYKQIACDA